MYYKKSCDDDDYENANGIRVKITFTFTGEEQVLNPYATVSVLRKIELPSNEFTSGIIVVTIPGIFMERNRDPNFHKNGYVVFMRNTVSEESFNLKNHEHHHK